MRKQMNRVQFGASQTMSWPGFCILCLNPATTEDSVAIGGGHVPYCDNCYVRVRRLRSWKDSIFMVSLIIGTLGAAIGLIGVIARESWVALFRMQSWLQVIFTGFLFMGIVYALLWGLILPLRLILRSKVADPGVKALKSKELGVTVLRFSNPQYADMFRRANNLSIPGGGD